MIDPALGFQMDKAINSPDLSPIRLTSPSIRLLADSILADFILADSILADEGVGGWESDVDLVDRPEPTLPVGCGRCGWSDPLSLEVGRRLGWST